MPMMNAAALEALLASDFPQLNGDGTPYSVVSVSDAGAVMRLTPSDRNLRPGGTIAGPALFALADVTAYVAILAQIGPVALAVTTNMSINFLRKPALAPVVSTGRILKLGKRLAIVDMLLEEIPSTEPLA